MKSFQQCEECTKVVLCLDDRFFRRSNTNQRKQQSNYATLLEVLLCSWGSMLAIFSAVPYLISLVLYVVPVFLIQSFLGQFSSSGFLSTFRICPLFKGMAYIGLALNITILTYIGIFAAVPLLYVFYSIRPTLPWSCEEIYNWLEDITPEPLHKVCNVTIIASNTTNVTYYSGNIPSINGIPSYLFFRSLFNNDSFVYPGNKHFYLPWQLVCAMFVIWLIIALVFSKIINLKRLGQLIRYTIWLLLTLLVICIIRFLFLPRSLVALEIFLIPTINDFIIGLSIAPFFAASTFGTGWGAIITLASYNKFKTNIMRYSWLIPFGHMLIILMFGLMSTLVDHHFRKFSGYSFHTFIQHHWIMLLSAGSVMADLELPNMWCILFYGLMTLSSLLVMITQLFTLLTTLFDDFESLRQRKQEVTYALIGFLALCSIYFCSNYGLNYFVSFTADVLFAQTLLNLLLIFVVLWVYGRERFQRDLEFMLGQRFATWRIFILRFVTPLDLIATMLLAIVLTFFVQYSSSKTAVAIAILSMVLLWTFIPGYAIFKLIQTTGTFCVRWRRCCRPTDWYPIDSEDRQRYEEAMGNMDITHQLEEIREEIS